MPRIVRRDRFATTGEYGTLYRQRYVVDSRFGRADEFKRGRRCYGKKLSFFRKSQITRHRQSYSTSLRLQILPSTFRKLLQIETPPAQYSRCCNLPTVLSYVVCRGSKLGMYLRYHHREFGQNSTLRSQCLDKTTPERRAIAIATATATASHQAAETHKRRRLKCGKTFRTEKRLDPLSKCHAKDFVDEVECQLCGKIVAINDSPNKLKKNVLVQEYQSDRRRRHRSPAAIVPLEQNTPTIIKQKNTRDCDIRTTSTAESTNHDANETNPFAVDAAAAAAAAADGATTIDQAAEISIADNCDFSATNAAQDHFSINESSLFSESRISVVGIDSSDVVPIEEIGHEDAVASSSGLLNSAGAVIYKEFPCVHCGELFDSLEVVKKHITDIHLMSSVDKKSEQRRKKNSANELLLSEKQKIQIACQKPHKYSSISEKVLSSLLKNNSAENAKNCVRSLDKDEKLFAANDLTNVSIAKKHFALPVTETVIKKDILGSKDKAAKWKSSADSALIEIEDNELDANLEPAGGEQDADYIIPHITDAEDFKFQKKCDLDRHIGIHSDGIAYRCEICDSTFNQENTLKTHLRKHTQSANEAWPCDVCGSAFVSAKTLKTHKVRRHPETLNAPVKDVTVDGRLQIIEMDKHVDKWCVSGEIFPDKMVDMKKYDGTSDFYSIDKHFDLSTMMRDLFPDDEKQ
ncbi:hypothetical protein U1Q18_048089 [Sarracenia purpurea var. burkii]